VREIAVRPFDGRCVLVVMADVAHELAREVLDRGENPAGDHLAFDAGEPQVDLIEPRGIGWSEMQVQLGMLGQELCDPPGLMRREVVGDNVDLPAFGFQRNDLVEKGYKLLGGMVGDGLPQDLAAFGLQRSVERERAMPIVLEAVALGSPRAQRQHRVFAIERLDGGPSHRRKILRRAAADQRTARSRRRPYVRRAATASALAYRVPEIRAATTGA